MAEPRKRAMVFIDHDLIIRNFINSRAFQDLNENWDVTYVFNDDPTTEETSIFSNIDELELPRVLTTHITRERMASWYKLYAIGAMHDNRGTAQKAYCKQRLYETHGYLRTNIFDVLGLPGIYAIAQRYVFNKQGHLPELKKLIKAEKPDVLIHPSVLAGYFVNELLVLKDILEIPFLVLMNSWDNPSQRAMTIDHPDCLGVWGEETKDQAIEYMNMPADRIRVLGAAQYQGYRTPVSDDDLTLRRMFKVPQDKPIVLYGGISQSLDEIRHLTMLEDKIETGEIPDCHILYRPHPWRGDLVENEDNFFDHDYKHISMDPFMENYYRRISTMNDRGMDMSDFEISRKLLKMVSGTISSLSTLLLDTVLHGKPTIAFMPHADMVKKFGRPEHLLDKLAHFKGLWGRPGVDMCRSDDNLSASIANLLKQSNDEDLHQTMLEYAQRFVDLSEPNYSTRLYHLAEEMTSQ
ncbi:hypothetical protein V5T82_08945 [Magnetovibrio sp. PR-2]|uniref:hypothetical protein n=1 Tax=Magnetovibrio sp. PR-2 TaxID=3120356 RepID=UPI002FCDE97F